MFLILWEFEVKPGEELAFEKAYGPEGLWGQLFRGNPHYRETKLLKDPLHSRIYYTLDFWESENHYKRFQQLNHGTYAELDKTTECLTIRERNLGCFLQHGPEPTSS